jgi:uncharacterized membrane protein YkvA (DUF1232 family)
MLQALLDQFRLTLRLMTDPRVPLWTKAIPVLALLYVLSPVDFIPDVIPVLGQADDVGIMLGAMRLMELVAPDEVVRALRKDLA